MNHKELLTHILAHDEKVQNCDPMQLLNLINSTFLQIKECTNLEESQKYFDLLQNAQEIISELFFAEKITLSKELRKFVRDCERLVDPWLREYLFKKIKENNYFYEA
jgi:hypothetical protein